MFAHNEFCTTAPTHKRFFRGGVQLGSCDPRPVRKIGQPEECDGTRRTPSHRSGKVSRTRGLEGLAIRLPGCEVRTRAPSVKVPVIEGLRWQRKQRRWTGRPPGPSQMVALISTDRLGICSLTSHREDHSDHCRPNALNRRMVLEPLCLVYCPMVLINVLQLPSAPDIPSYEPGLSTTNVSRSVDAGWTDHGSKGGGALPAPGDME
jgi:hypothetical protein